MSNLNDNTSTAPYALWISITFEDAMHNNTSDMNDMILILDQMLHEIRNHSISDTVYIPSTHRTDIDITSLNVTIYVRTSTAHHHLFLAVNRTGFQQQFIQRIQSETNISSHKLTFYIHGIIGIPSTTDGIFTTTHDQDSAWHNHQIGILWIIVVTLSTIIFCYVSGTMIQYICRVIHRSKDHDSKCKDHIQYNTELHVQTLTPQITEDPHSKERGEMTHSSEFTVTDSNIDLYGPGPIIVTPADEGETKGLQHLQRKISEYKRVMTEGKGDDDENGWNGTNLPRPPPRKNTWTITVDGIAEEDARHPFAVVMDDDINTHSYQHDMMEPSSQNKKLQLPRTKVVNAQW